MKKIIKNLLYNTDTAQEIGSISEHGYGDMQFFRETLYRKKTGEYFLHGSGGAMSKYSKCVNDSMIGTEIIKPLSYADASTWAEKNLTAEEYINEFGDIAESEEEGTINMHVQVDISLYNAIKREAQMRNVSLRTIVEEKFRAE